MDEKNLKYCPFPFGATTKEQILTYIRQQALPFEESLKEAVDAAEKALVEETEQMDPPHNVVVSMDTTSSPNDGTLLQRGRLRGCTPNFLAWDDAGWFLEPDAKDKPIS